MTQGPATHDINLSVMTNTLERATVSFGGIQVDFVRREIRNQEQLLQVGSRAFDILELLANANGELVSKDEIMRAVWPTTVVEENNVQVHVSALRKAFGAESELIKTDAGRGYRLLQTRGPNNNRNAGTAPPETEASGQSVPTSSMREPMQPSVDRNIAELVGRDQQLKELKAALRRST